ncbi:hypothetical protein ACFPVT_01410 [Corynebacterium choanae]|uniref:hypothetical protein n=1 Tax=Corynebacterium choanae TaxID=1862358 RepID=UPI000F50E895|nr:hypothetical protein [Corynebacterium choanae]
METDIIGHDRAVFGQRYPSEDEKNVTIGSVLGASFRIFSARRPWRNCCSMGKFPSQPTLLVK